MSNFFIPKNYQSLLNVRQAEKAIKLIKDFFQQHLSTELNLYRTTAPLFVKKGTGINDDLNGTEKPVSFSIKNAKNLEVEIVQSLAKWKRLALADYDISVGYGIYADMNAIRPDDTIDNTHSLYVDQWDWERVISAEERSIEYLKHIVKKIYSVLKRLEFYVYESYPAITPILPEEITFIHSEEALERYPNLSPEERESALAKEYGAVFVIGIGSVLQDGRPHGGRAPDYDDWSTETVQGFKGLNGDIILWNPVLKNSFEISSMGIRVDKKALLNQLKITNTEQRKELYFHRRLLNDELPLSIGGGIGQSRICMYFLRKAHIGEVQVGIWPEEMIAELSKNNIFLL
jgi:aspartate--ammonia ligase